MRKLIVSMNVTLNGFIAGPNDELDWHFPHWTSEMNDYARIQLAAMDTILLGRVTYETMASYWPTAPADEFCSMMNEYRKIVCSRSRRYLEWNNSILISQNIAEEIQALKTQTGRNIVIYGSGTMVESFMRLGLIDEYRFWVHPVLISEGKTLFKGSGELVNLRLIRTKTFDSGVTILYYQPMEKLLPLRDKDRTEHGERMH